MLLILHCLKNIASNVDVFFHVLVSKPLSIIIVQITIVLYGIYQKNHAEKLNPFNTSVG